MSVNAKTIKKYKVVHTWTGIISSIVLFIAFYAGALAMFKPEIAAWTQARLQAPAGSANIDALAAAFFGDDGSPQGSATLVLPHASDPTARIYYAEGGKHRSAYLDQTGQLQVIDNATGGTAIGGARTAGDFVDDVHRAGGLPVDVETAEPIIGIVSLLYGVALVSGVIVLLPSLVKDLFLLRITHNVRRMWLDAHNVLGLTSLPFHIVMALSAAVFGLHHYIYDAQEAVIYPQDLPTAEVQASTPTTPPPPPIASKSTPPSQLLAGLKATAPTFQPTAIRYFPPRNPNDASTVRVQGPDDGQFQRGGRFTVAMLDLATGELVNSTYLPGKQTAAGTTLTSFFALHFGNFGGLPVRLLYIVLGVLGAIVFYSGNLLWIESRLSKSRSGNQPAEQPRHLRWVSSLTIGACLGCVAGLSASLLAVRWLSTASLAPDLMASYAYHGVFLAFVVMAFAVGAARVTAPLLGLAASASILIPLTSMLDAASGASINAVTSLPAYWLVDSFFALTAAVLFYLTYRARRRYQMGPRVFPRVGIRGA